MGNTLGNSLLGYTPPSSEVIVGRVVKDHDTHREEMNEQSNCCSRFAEAFNACISSVTSIFAASVAESPYVRITQAIDNLNAGMGFFIQGDGLPDPLVYAEQQITAVKEILSEGPQLSGEEIKNIATQIETAEKVEVSLAERVDISKVTEVKNMYTKMLNLFVKPN